jgi:hypothetical protein
MRNSLYMIGRIHGSLYTVDIFCKRMKIEWIRPMLRYNLFLWFFKWYCHSHIGKILERMKN